MITDFRLAFRALMKAPGFAGIAILTLALGLGMNIAVFGMINEFMIRPLPVRDARHLMFVMQRNPKITNMPFPLSYPDYQDMRRQIESTAPEDASIGAVFSGLMAYATQAAHVSETGTGAQRGWVHEVSDNYFEFLGVRPALGRLFEKGEGTKRNADPVIVLSHKYWSEHFGRDRAVIGRKLYLNGAPFTIIGVTADKFVGAEAMVAAQLFVPAMMADVLRPHMTNAIASRGTTMYMVMARTHAGVTAAQAEIAANRMLQSLIKAYPDQHAESAAVVIAEAQSRPSPFVSQFTAPALAALMFLALLVLAVAAANIANLLFARAAAAERALAIRSALGATRLALIRLLVAESILVAIGAGFVGWGVSQVFGYSLSRIGMSGDNPPLADPERSLWPVVFTVAAAILTGIITGILPAWRSTRLDVLSLLKDSGPTATRTRHPFRTLLVGGQIALACIVLVCAGLAIRSLHGLAHVELGFRPRNVVIATFDLEMQRYTRQQAENFHHELLLRARALPGVVAAGLARTVPFDKNYGLRGGISAEGYVPRPKEDFLANCVAISPGFQEAMGMSLISGRAFTEHDDAKAPAVAIVSRSVAAHFWPDQDAVGRRLIFDGGTRMVEVVGVVGDMRYLMMADPGKPQIFLPLAQDFSARTTLVLRTDKAPEAAIPAIEAIGRRLDPRLPVHNPTTFERHIATSPMALMTLRLGTLIAGTQAAVVLLLSIMGVYGLVAFAVTRRTREIGIRIALGATSREVIQLVTRPSVVLTTVGLGIGLAVSALITRQVAVLLYGTAGFDWLVMGSVAAMLVAVTLLACWFPARRATSVNPVDALRAE